MGISDREYDVLIRMHWTARQTGIDLDIAENTVKKLRQRIYRKFNTKSNASTLVKALKRGIIELDALEPYSWHYKT